MEDVVYQGKTNKGDQILIRPAKLSDASAMTDYINALSDERTFITYQGEHETVESETKFLEDRLKNVQNQKAVFLVALINDRIVGNAWVGVDKKTSRHIGTLGISVAKDFRGEGIGKVLMQTVIDEAKKLPGIEILTLGAFANNEIAINWYKSLGFVEYGKLPNGIKLENGYVDHVYMYLRIK